MRIAPDTRLNETASRSISKNFVVTVRGRTKNIPNPTKRAKISEAAFAKVPGLESALSGSRSSMLLSADHCSVPMPIFNVSNRAIIPRKIGMFSDLCFSRID